MAGVVVGGGGGGGGGADAPRSPFKACSVAGEGAGRGGAGRAVEIARQQHHLIIKSVLTRT